MANLAPPPESPQDGVKLGSEFNLNRLADELTALRTREGLMYDRVKVCGELISIAHTWKSRQPSNIAQLDNASAAIAMIKDVLEDERPVEYRDSLKITYGLVVNGLSRDERVRKYLDLPKWQRTVHSRPSIERHSKSMAAQLAAKLVSLASTNSSSPVAAASVGISAESSMAYAMDVVRMRHRMKSNRFLRDVVYARTITCLAPGDHFYLAGTVHYSDTREGIHRIEPEFGCELVRDYYENGTYFAQLRLTKTLFVGEQFEFVYKIILDAGSPCVPFLSMTPNADVGKLVYSVEFADDAIPAKYWRFGDIDYLGALSQENRRQVACLHDGSRHIRETWQDLRKGVSYGIDWDW